MEPERSADERALELALANEVLRYEIEQRKRAEEDLVAAYGELASAYEETIRGWALALELRDRETRGHAQRVTRLAVLLGEAIGLDQEALVHLRRGAMLHDVGKMGIPDRILLKEGPLTDAEMEVMRGHTTLARDMLASIPFLSRAVAIPYCHHERWDGSGYPRGLSGEEIPAAARIFAVVDVWDALRSVRPYKPAWAADRARAYIAAESGRHFDPAIAAAFLAMDAESDPMRTEP